MQSVREQHEDAFELLHVYGCTLFRASIAVGRGGCRYPFERRHRLR